jgi:hypothetical protein
MPQMSGGRNNIGTWIFSWQQLPRALLIAALKIA